MYSDSAKINEVITEYRKPVFRQALRILGNVCAAEEVTQEVFLRVYKGLDRFREDSQLSTWIYKILANRCLSRLKKTPIHFISLEEVESDEVTIDPDSNPEEQHIKHDTETRLAHSISRLPSKEATAITLYYDDDKSYDEIARIMLVPSGTVAVLLHRGRIHLHQLLVPQENKERKQ